MYSTHWFKYVELSLSVRWRSRGSASVSLLYAIAEERPRPPKWERGGRARAHGGSRAVCNLITHNPFAMNWRARQAEVVVLLKFDDLVIFPGTKKIMNHE